MARTATTRKQAPKQEARPALVHQFLVVLGRTDPLVWRRIQVPERYSFWDLHVAIQDAMGWHDSHLHEFRLVDVGERGVVTIGVPMGNEAVDRPVIPGWEAPLARFFEHGDWHLPPALYAYDFGDEWEHALVHEGVETADPSLDYPRCIAGARRCPPEDCGGPAGYAELLRAIGDPDDFKPDAVTFDDPKKRWHKAFGR